MASVLELERLIVRLGIDASRYIQGMTAAGRHATSLEARIRKLGMALTVGVTIPLTIMGGVALQEFKKFDKAMTESLAIMDNVSGRMRKDMEAVAEATSMLLPHTPAKLAEVYYSLASAGFTAADSIKMMPVAAKFATAGAMQLSKATDLLTGSFVALGLRVPEPEENMKRMNMVANALVAVNNLAIGSVTDFANALENKAGAAMRLVNKDIYEGLAVLAAYAQQGVQSRLAGSKLEITLRELDFAARSSAGMWQKLGIAVYDGQGRMRHMVDILRDMEGVLGPMSDKMRRTTLEMLGFRARSVQSIIPLIGMSDYIMRTEKALRMMNDEMEDVAKNQMASFHNQLQLVTNDLIIFFTDIGRTLAPTILEIGAAIKGLIADWKGLSQQSKENILGWTALVAAAGPALVAFSLMIPAVRGLMGAFVAVSAAIRAVTVAIAAMNLASFVSGIQSVILSIRMWSTALTGLMGTLLQVRAIMMVGTWGAFGIAVAALAVAYQALNKQAEKFNETLKERSRLQNQLVTREQREMSAVMEKANSLTGKDRAEFLEDEIEKWNKIADARVAAAHAAKEEVKRRSAATIENRGLFGSKTWMGNKELELAKQNMDELRQSADATQDFVSQLRAEFVRMEPAMGLKQSGTPADVESLADLDHAEGQHQKQFDAYVQKLKDAQREQTLVAQGMGEREAEVVRLAESLGILNTAEAQNALVMAAKADYDKFLEPLQKYNQELDKQIATFGMNERQQEIYEMRQKGFTTAELQSTIAKSKQIDVLEAQKKAQKEHQELLEEGKKLTEEYYTPQEKFTETEKKLTDMLNKKAISQETYNRAIKAAKEEMQKVNKETEVAAKLQKEFPEGLNKGSARAFDFALEQRMRLQHMRQMALDAWTDKNNFQRMVAPSIAPGIGGAFAPEEGGSAGRNPYENRVEGLLVRIEQNTRPSNGPQQIPVLPANFGTPGNRRR